MSNEAFEIKARIEDAYCAAWRDGVRAFKVAYGYVRDEDIANSTAQACREIWRDFKKARGSTETDPEKPLAGGEVQSPDENRTRLSGRRFVLTSAQNNTYLHDDFWAGLVRFAECHDAQLLVSRFSYNKNAWRKASGLHELDQKDDAKAQNNTDLWYDPRILPYVCDKQVKLADGLVFCGELDILPTTVYPLNGLQNYTGPNSGIVPHAKVHANSLATMKNEPAKFMYSTGTATLRNYIDRRAGQIATFHHTFAALYVEVDDDDNWFVRQLVADDNGVFYDLDRAYGPNWDRPASDFGDTLVTLGDIHIEKVDPLAVSGALEMARFVNAAEVFVHDLSDFTARNHHNMHDPHFMVEQHYQGVQSVENGMIMAARFLHGINNVLPDVRVNVIRSNHDQAFERWLKDLRGFQDPVNAPYWCYWNTRVMYAKKEGRDYDVYADCLYDACEAIGSVFQNVHFVQEDESYIKNDIEHGMHGHRGPNGARGNPRSFRQMGSKVNTAHTHSFGIIDGVWTAGTLSKLDLGYNSGPSSWSHSSIVTYPSGKRTIITQRGRKWRG